MLARHLLRVVLVLASTVGCGDSTGNTGGMGGMAGRGGAGGTAGIGGSGGSGGTAGMGGTGGMAGVGGRGGMGGMGGLGGTGGVGGAGGVGGTGGATGMRYLVPSSIDATGMSDVSTALNQWVGGLPDGTINLPVVVVFSAGAVYRMDVGLQLANRHDSIFEGNGATLRVGPASDGASQLTSLFVLGHMFGGYWAGNVDRIIVHGFVLIGNNPTPGSFTPGVEGQAGFEIEGTSHVEIYDNTIRSVFSDGFKVGGSDQVHIHDNHVIDAGRNGVSIISGSNVEMDHNDFGTIGYVTFDVEPNQATESCTFLNFHDNTAATWEDAFFALDGSHTGAPIHDVTVDGNTISGRSLLTIVDNGGTTRNTNITFTNNRSTVSAAGPVLRFAHVDGLDIRGNVQPLSSGVLAQITDCTNVMQ